MTLVLGRAHRKRNNVTQALPVSARLSPDHELLQTLVHDQYAKLEQVDVSHVEGLLLRSR